MTEYYLFAKESSSLKILSGILTGRYNIYIRSKLKRVNLYYECTNRTPSVTHPDVALDVEGRGAGEPEGLHVGVDLGLEEAALGPGAPEPAD